MALAPDSRFRQEPAEGVRPGHGVIASQRRDDSLELIAVGYFSCLLTQSHEQPRLVDARCLVLDQSVLPELLSERPVLESLLMADPTPLGPTSGHMVNCGELVAACSAFG